MEIRLLRNAEEKSVLRQHDEALSIPHFSGELLPFRSYLAAFEGKKLLGLACFVESSSRIPGALGLGYLSVHPQERNRGVATKLAQALFQLAQSEGKAIANTHYEPDGEKWLRPVMTRIAAQTTGVVLHERN
jgi:GNAT superfamily N-acetyltransferase